MQAAQLLMLAMENNMHGAPHVNVSKKANPALYARVIECYARIMCCMPKKGDHEIWKANSSGRYAFSVSTQTDVVRAIAECRTRQNAPPRGAQGAAAQAAPVAIPAPQAGPLSILDRLGAFAVNGCVSGDIVPGHRTQGTLFEHMTVDQSKLLLNSSMLDIHLFFSVSLEMGHFSTRRRRSTRRGKR
jgi:hypothetical protein